VQRTGLYFFNNLASKASRSDKRPELSWLIGFGEVGTSGIILCNALGELPAGFEEAVCWRETCAEGCRLAIHSRNRQRWIDSIVFLHPEIEMQQSEGQRQ
jgi:hypothetical protein